ncbi:hypothetical protein GCM10020255_075310 [Rhodococcus baikonurensis]
MVAIVVLVRQWRDLRSAESNTPAHTNRFVQVYSVVYLVVMAVLWASALPDFFDAVDGSTSAGDPIGNLWYTLACFVIAILCERNFHNSEEELRRRRR